MKEHRVYLDNSNTKRIIVFVSIIVLIYVFFFTSRITVPNKTKIPAAALGKKVFYEENQKSYKLLGANYSKEDKAIELFILFDNADISINEKYEVRAENSRALASKIEVVEKVDTEILSVYKLNNVSRFNYIKVSVKPKHSKYEFKFILDDSNVACVKHIQDKTKKEYLEERIELVIKNYKKDIDSEKRRIKKIKYIINNLDQKNMELEESKKYQTPKEISDSNDKIDENLNAKVEYQKKISNAQKRIKNYEKEIKKAEEVKEKI